MVISIKINMFKCQNIVLEKELIQLNNHPSSHVRPQPFTLSPQYVPHLFNVHASYSAYPLVPPVNAPTVRTLPVHTPYSA